MWQPNEVDMAAVDKWSMKDRSLPDDIVVEAEVGDMYYSPFPSHMRSSEITKDNLRVGDLIEHPTEGQRRILECGETCFLPSLSEDYSTANISWWSYENANWNGWRIKLPPEEQAPLELTHEEVEQRLGVKVKIIDG